MMMLKIALPNGSLEETTFKLFEEAGITIEKLSPRSFVGEASDPRIARLRIIRPQQIPYLVERGGDDVGICGLDCVKESESDVMIVREFDYSKKGFVKVKVVLFANAADSIQDPSEIPPYSEIISEYPNCTRKFFEKLGIPVKIDFSYGKTEAYVPNDYRFGVCIMETGTTLKETNQKILAVLFESPVVLITNRKTWSDPQKRKLIEELANELSEAYEKLKRE